jgi:Bacterial Ig-like domain (group 2)
MRDRRMVLGCIAALGVLLAACSDRSPTGGLADDRRGPVSDAYTCSVTVATGETRCVRAQGATPAGPTTKRRALLMGSTYAQLNSRNVSYDGVSAFTFEVAVTNLIGQKIGTTDGTTVDASGIRVFFHSGPTVTSGSGTITVVPDGYATFLAPSQAYYEYAQLLNPSAQSSWRTWTFQMPPTVISFAFTVYVYAAVQYPNGWVAVTPANTYLYLDEEAFLTARLYNVAGAVDNTATFTWSSDNETVATVSSGLVHANDAGDATITATTGTRSGTSHVHVY